MINIIKNKIYSYILNLIRQAVYPNQYRDNEQVAQKNFILNVAIAKKNNCLPDISDIGFKVYSQYEEDGILLFIFSVIGTANKKVVEICAGDGTECMASNLIINHGWEGLLFDGNPDNVLKGINFFNSNVHTSLCPPLFINSWITKDNINELISQNGYSGIIDLLSVDIDGNDYHILKAIYIIKPRIIICEIHNVIPSDLSITMPYDEKFYFKNGSYDEDYRSASLLAIVNLLKKKGYRLIASNKYGFNAVFILNEVDSDNFKTLNIGDVLNNKYSYLRQKKWDKVKDYKWEYV